jgi:hypothetical protein
LVDHPSTQPCAIEFNQFFFSPPSFSPLDVSWVYSVPWEVVFPSLVSCSF